MQEVWAGTGSAARLVRMPRGDAEALPGVTWGTPDEVNTPAYWAVRCRWEGAVPSYSANGATLVEEVGFCLLGGFGVRFEVANAAFERLRTHGAFDLAREISEAEVVELLTRPLEVGGRPQRYRFPNQRAGRISSMRRRLARSTLEGLGPMALRDALMGLDGVGPKTASWIVRNHLDSDDVAIIDVHVIRACRGMGVFACTARLPQDYPDLERRFLALARAIDVRPSILDAVMWSEVRAWRH